MWRNGKSSDESNASRSGSGTIGKVMTLVGGIGVGAGLLYLLDPSAGARRRQRLMLGAQHLGSGVADSAHSLFDTARHALGGTMGAAGSALGSVGSTVSDYAGTARDYAGDKLQGARQYAIESLGGEEKHSHILGNTICALSSMALGAAIMYVFDPSSGKGRRQVAKDYAREHLGEVPQKVSSAVSMGYKAVAEKVTTGAQAVSGAVSKVASKVGIGSSNSGGQNSGNQKSGAETATA